MDGCSGETSGTLLTPLGKVMRNFTFPESIHEISSVNIDLTGLPKGIYLVRYNSSSFTYVQKLVIE
jgi:hypothetical protein